MKEKTTTINAIILDIAEYILKQENIVSFLLYIAEELANDPCQNYEK